MNKKILSFVGFAAIVALAAVVVSGCSLFGNRVTDDNRVGQTADQNQVGATDNSATGQGTTGEVDLSQTIDDLDKDIDSLKTSDFNSGDLEDSAVGL